MFRGRRQLQRRDRESGLAFNWRVPVSSTGSFVVAFLLIAAVAVGLATVVRVSIAPASRGEPEQGTLVIVPPDVGGRALARRAMEAGPFPARWNPAADPEYVALRRQALKEAGRSDVEYRPELRQTDWLRAGAKDDPSFDGGDLPPLPRSAGSARERLDRDVMVGARVLDSGGVKGFTHASLAMNAEEAGPVIGGRYVIEHDAEGRILDVVALSPRLRQPAVVEWLSRGLVTGHQGKPGWLSVETVVAR